MEYRHVGAFFEFQAVQFLAYGENAFGGVVEREVGFGLFFRKVEFFSAYLFGIVPPVPCFGFEIAAFAVYHGLYVGKFLLGAFQGGSPYLVHQFVSLFRRFGHVLV